MKISSYLNIDHKHKSDQFIIFHFDYLVIRLGKPYLATLGVIIHGHYGETLLDS